MRRRLPSRVRSASVRQSHLDAARPRRFNRQVLLYALVAADCDFAVDLYPTLALAEQALAEVLADEPLFAELLSVAVVSGQEASLN